MNIGEAHAGRSPDSLRATLGSCVGIAMHWSAGEIFGLAHALLPERSSGDGRHGFSARYADVAVTLLLRRMRVRADRQAEVQAMVLGGANMFRAKASRMAVDVGGRNVEVATFMLERLGIQIVGADVGGKRARSIAIDCSTGRLVSSYVPPLGSQLPRRVGLDAMFSTDSGRLASTCKP